MREKSPRSNRYRLYTPIIYKSSAMGSRFITAMDHKNSMLCEHRPTYDRTQLNTCYHNNFNKYTLNFIKAATRMC